MLRIMKHYEISKEELINILDDMDIKEDTIQEGMDKLEETNEIENMLTEYEDNIYEFVDFVTNIETLEEDYPEVIEFLSEIHQLSWGRVYKISKSGESDEDVIIPLKIAAEIYSNIDTGIDYLWNIQRDVVEMGYNKEDFAKDWYENTSGLTRDILEQIEIDLVIDWEETFNQMFKYWTIVEHDYKFYGYNN